MTHASAVACTAADVSPDPNWPVSVLPGVLVLCVEGRAGLRDENSCGGREEEGYCGGGTTALWLAIARARWPSMSAPHF